MSEKDAPFSIETKLVHEGRWSDAHFGAVNTPVYHASTILFPNVARMQEIFSKHYDNIFYGRYGTPTTRSFEEALCALEGGYRTVCFPSGMAAVAAILSVFLSQGDHLLMVDSGYDPSRRFAANHLKRFGVETTYYDPRIGGRIRELIRPTTKLVFCESPGSHTFEIQDIPAIVEAAHEVGALVAMDNTWATPLLFAPLAFGVDLSMMSCTKYIVGHADAMMGSVTVATEDIYKKLRLGAASYGYAVGSDEAYLATRGLRTLAVRLKQHEENGLQVARWLAQRSDVVAVHHPALPSHPDHALFKRDFKGASGLFGVEFSRVPRKAAFALMDSLKLFKIGYSWGGFESLMVPTFMGIERSAYEWKPKGTPFRLSIGLENPADLMADLDRGLALMYEVAAACGPDEPLA
jgi:cystathionine beta-lyase